MVPRSRFGHLQNWELDPRCRRAVWSPDRCPIKEVATITTSSSRHCCRPGPPDDYRQTEGSANISNYGDGETLGIDHDHRQVCRFTARQG